MTGVVNPWAKHYQRSWEERAGDRHLPAWLRVAALAYGKHAANGHAVFRRGQIGQVLATPDKDGVLRPYANVSRAIGTAVRYGWLRSGSNGLCLVVPLHAIGGGIGSPHSACPIHDIPAPSRAHLRAVAA